MIARRSTLVGLGLLLGVGVAACFEGEWLEGRPCMTDEDCGPSFVCSTGFCGGPQCPMDALENGLCPCPGPSNWACDELEHEVSRKIDVLLVLDDASSELWNDQARVIGIGRAVYDALDETLADFRIGITTTDMGSAGCEETTAPRGRLLFSSCRDRVWDFVHEDLDVRAACLEECDHADLVAEPTPLVPGGEELASRPWLEGNAVVSNTGEIAPLDALACLVPQGIAGCRFAEPLEAMHAALDRVEDPEEPSFGFLRDDANLLVLVVTDGPDCSTQDPAIFDPQGLKTFWSDPDASPSPAVCWNAGTKCSGGPGTYDACEPVDLGLDGAAASEASDAVLFPLSRYTDRLEAIRDGKHELDPNLQVVVAAIAGVPEGYPDAPIVYADADMAFMDEHGIGPGCGEVGAAFALPPVRLRALAEQFAPAGDPAISTLASACAPDDAPALDPVRAVLPVGLPPLCMEACVKDFSDSIPGVQPECTLAFVKGDALVDIPHCTFLAGQPAVPGDADLCYYELQDDQVSPDCADSGSNLEFGFLTAAGTGTGVEPPGQIFASCAPSSLPEEECPQ